MLQGVLCGVAAQYSLKHGRIQLAMALSAQIPLRCFYFVPSPKMLEGPMRPRTISDEGTLVVGGREERIV